MKKYKNRKALNPKSVLATLGLQELSKFELAATRGGAPPSGSGFLGQLTSVLLQRGTPELVLSSNTSNASIESLCKWQNALVTWGYAKNLSPHQLACFAFEGQRYINPTRNLSTIVVFSKEKSPRTYHPIITESRPNKTRLVKPFSMDRFSDIIVENLTSCIFKISNEQKELIQKTCAAELPERLEQEEIHKLYKTDLIDWVSYTKDEKEKARHKLYIKTRLVSAFLYHNIKNKFISSFPKKQRSFESSSPFKGSLRWLEGNLALSFDFEKHPIENLIPEFLSICENKKNLILASAEEKLKDVSSFYIKGLLDENNPQSFLSQLIKKCDPKPKAKDAITRSIAFCQKNMADAGFKPRGRSYNYLNADFKYFALGASRINPEIKTEILGKSKEFFDEFITFRPEINTVSENIFTYASKTLSKILSNWFKPTPDYLKGIREEFYKENEGYKINPNMSEKEKANINIKFHQYVLYKKEQAVRSMFYDALTYDYARMINIVERDLLTHKIRQRYDRKACYQALASLLQYLRWCGAHFSNMELRKVISPEFRDSRLNVLLYVNKKKIPFYTSIESFQEINSKKMLRTFIKNRSAIPIIPKAHQ